MGDTATTISRCGTESPADHLSYPSLHRRGIRDRLFSVAEAAVSQHQCDGLLVKAQQDATGFLYPGECADWMSMSHYATMAIDFGKS